MKKLIFVIGFLSLFGNGYSQWVHAGGPSSGAYVAINGNRVFSTNGSQLHYSIDSGNNWNYFPNFSNNYSIAMLKFNGNDLYAMTSSYIKKTTDYGISWSTFYSGSFLLDLIFKDNFIFISDDAGVHRTSNNGQSWVLVNNGLTTQIFFNMYSLNGYIYGSCPSNYDGGIYRSSNNGDNWEKMLFTGLPSPYPGSYTSLNNALFVTVMTHGIYKSTNNGINWASSSEGIVNKNVNDIHSDGSNLYACSGDGLYKSTNGGENWVIFAFQGQSMFNFAQQSGNMFVSNSKKIFHSTNNGINWVEVNLSNLSIFSLSTINEKIFACTPNGPYYTTNNGTNWVDFSLDINNDGGLTSFFSANNYYFAVNENANEIFRSSNGGLNWIVLPNSFYSFWNFVTNGNYLYLDSRDGIDGGYFCRSTNNGANWDSLKYFFKGSYSIIAKNSEVYYASYTKVFYSSDYGISWDSNDNPNNKRIMHLHFKENDILGASDSSLFLTTNKGFQWNNLNLNGHHINAIEVLDNSIIIGSNDGVYITSNNGVNWLQKNEGLEYLKIRAFTICNGFIFAGTDFTSTYKRPLNEVVIKSISSIIPDKYSLSQNYPNPFNPSTNIRYTIPSNVKGKMSNVKLVVFDILGKEIATLVNEKLNAGTYEVTFDGSGLTSGVYFYRLTCGDFSETRKMALLK